VLVPAVPAPELGAQGRIQTFNLWFVGPALRQLSYSGGNTMQEQQAGAGVCVLFPQPDPASCCYHLLLIWSELESNQPFGLFRPALIRLSYPTRSIADCRLLIAD
jgi:hypothetical protein